MKVLITGGTGTLGSALIEKLTSSTFQFEVVSVSRDEQKAEAAQKINPKVHYALGDVRDRDMFSRLRSKYGHFSVIFHLAALKSAPFLEASPNEAIATNIDGTRNVCDYAKAIMSRVVFASTDKACYPINTYGLTKAIAEKIVNSYPENVVCRYGNVLGSRGSVVPVIADKLLAGKPVPITDLKMTRFWMPLDEVVKVVSACRFASTPRVVPDIQAAPVASLVKAVAECLAIEDFTFEKVGIRPGEKLHETLLTAEENNGLEVRSDDPKLQWNYFCLKSAVKKTLERLGYRLQTVPDCTLRQA